MEGGSQQSEDRRLKLKFSTDQKVYQSAYTKSVNRRRVEAGAPSYDGRFDMCQERIWEDLKPHM